jgi:hypothetical protein
LQRGQKGTGVVVLGEYLNEFTEVRANLVWVLPEVICLQVIQGTVVDLYV